MKVKEYVESIKISDMGDVKLPDMRIESTTRSMIDSLAWKLDCVVSIIIDERILPSEEFFEFKPNFFNSIFKGEISINTDTLSDYNVMCICHELAHATQRYYMDDVGVMMTVKEKLIHELEACELAKRVYQKYFRELHPGIDEKIFELYRRGFELETLFSNHLVMIQKLTTIDLDKHFQLLCDRLGRKCDMVEGLEMISKEVDPLYISDWDAYKK